jgi:hypothetical protein
MAQFSLSNGGGLLIFPPGDVTELVTSHIGRQNVMDSNSSTLLLSLATSLTKLYSNTSRPEILPEISLLMNYLTDTLLPPTALPEMATFAPEILHAPLTKPFHDIILSNPELLFEYFGFLAHTMQRYSITWTPQNVQRWMLCILISLGIPEGGMSFQGAIDFLVLLCINELMSDKSAQ